MIHVKWNGRFGTCLSCHDQGRIADKAPPVVLGHVFALQLPCRLFRSAWPVAQSKVLPTGNEPTNGATGPEEGRASLVRWLLNDVEFDLRDTPSGHSQRFGRKI